MIRVFNKFLSFLKYVLLLVCIGLTLYITLKLNLRLGKSLTSSIPTFIPYGALLLLFILNYSIERTSISKNIYFNLTCCLVFTSNIVVCLRAIFDTNMVFNGIQKLGVNFNFFNDYLSFNKIMLYGLILSDIIFMFIPNKKNKIIVRVPFDKYTNIDFYSKYAPIRNDNINNYTDSGNNSNNNVNNYNLNFNKNKKKKKKKKHKNNNNNNQNYNDIEML